MEWGGRGGRPGRHDVEGGRPHRRRPIAPLWSVRAVSRRTSVAVLDAGHAGHGSAMEAGLGQLKRRGRLVLVGAGMAAPKFDPNRILLNELVITGAFCYDADGFDRSLALLASGKLPVKHLIDPVDVPLTGT